MSIHFLNEWLVLAKSNQLLFLVNISWQHLLQTAKIIIIIIIIFRSFYILDPIHIDVFL